MGAYVYAAAKMRFRYCSPVLEARANHHAFIPPLSSYDLPHAVWLLLLHHYVYYLLSQTFIVPTRFPYIWNLCCFCWHLLQGAVYLWRELRVGDRSLVSYR